MRYDILASVTSLDPQYAYSEESKLIVRNTFQGLFDVDEDGNAVPAAAESYTFSSDGRKLTIRLREGMLWSDGETPVTAGDYAFALQRLFNPDFPSAYAVDFICIQNAQAILSGELPVSSLGVEAKDDLTLVITLEYSAPYILQLLASTAAMPCNSDFFTETRGRYGLDLDMLLYNGPFAIRFWDKEDYVQLKKNEYFIDAQTVLPSKVVCNVIGKEERFSRFQSGKTDAAVLSYEEYSRLDTEKLECQQFEDTSWVLIFNQEDPFLSSRNARRALALSIDHRTYAPNLANDLNDTNTFLPPSLMVYGKSYRLLAGFSREHAFSVSQAQEALEAAFDEGLTTPVLTILVPEDSTHPLTASAIQRNWRDTLALTANIQQLPVDQVVQRVNSGQYQVAILPIQPDSQRPDEMLNDFRSASTLNVAGYQSEEFDAALAAAESAHTQEELVAAYMEAENLLYSDAVLVPLYFQTHYYVMGKGVKGIRFSPFAGEIRFSGATK